ncbi:MAG: STAS domain-containing protein, partial [Phycisphaeraceae bacterium]
EAREVVALLRQGVEQGTEDFADPQWEPLREHLRQMLGDWIERGFTSIEVTGFILLFKRSVLLTLEKQAGQPGPVLRAVASMSLLMNSMALWMTEVFQKRMQSVINRQQEELMELSTPVVELWEGILALPLIGTLDTARTQVVMEALLSKITETGADTAIIDITGVPTVDTMVAQHLLKTVTAARLMGADCIISGIRPAIAQTMVQLGVDLREVSTKQTLASAFSEALVRHGRQVVEDGDGGCGQ